MDNNARRLLKYWRNSIVDSNRIQELPLENTVEISWEELGSGIINPGNAKKVWAIYLREKQQAQKTGREIEEKDDKITVLVCPVKLVKKYIHYQQNSTTQEIVPLWIPALMDEKGKLEPARELLPWIDRKILEPTTGTGIVLGDIEDVERYLEKNDPTEAVKDWPGYLEYAQKMLKSLPITREEIEAMDYTLTNGVYITPDLEIRGAAQRILTVMDHIITSKIIPPLLKRYARLEDEPEKPPMTFDEQLNLAHLHTGQMTGEFPLSDSQRQSLHHFLTMKQGEILAVNGPPGTGKTTLVHSMIATLWVDAAIQQTRPPIMLTVSANNQAVTNMIDSFGKVSKTDTLLSSRWLPGITSYGLYCPSQYAAQRQENQKYQIATAKSEFPATSGFMAKKESAAYLLPAKEHYLKCCSEYYGCEIKDIDQAIKKLHTELVNNQLVLKKTIEQYRETFRAQQQAAAAREKVKAKYGTLDNLTEALLARKDELQLKKAALEARLEQEKQSYNEARQTYLETFRMVQSNISSRTVQGGIITRLRYRLAQLLLGERRNVVVSNELSETLTRLLEKSETDMKQAEEAVLVCNQQNEQLGKEIKQLEDELAAITESKTAPSIEEIQSKCDTELRHRSFLLATHYWEGRWLKEVEKAHEMYQRNIKVTPEEKLRNKWRRYAMLTPGLVSTLYMAPAMFTSWYREGENLYSQPLWEEIDLLIIDEAGQVSPEIAAATMALAKKAVVVGDIWQIEPVYNITRFVDQGNLLRVGLISNKEEYPELQSKGVTAQGGSVMRIAGRSCPYRLKNENGEPYSERGMWLREHRRCLDTIIDYCNQLVYRGQLLPLRGDQLKPGALPHFSAVHFADGVSSRAGSSRKNEKEAVFILDWLLEKKEYLLNTYGPDKALKDIVAVVVPFTTQKREFLKALRSSEKYTPLRGITIGTIHALQGAERDVVIFSPVYTRSDGTDYFFNSDVRMLNVAVSRAREAFVVIGDTEIFRKAGGAAGLLARYIFAEK